MHSARLWSGYDFFPIACSVAEVFHQTISDPIEFDPERPENIIEFDELLREARKEQAQVSD